MQALGGILAGAVIKYAGAVLKGFALILGDIKHYIYRIFTSFNANTLQTHCVGLLLTGFAECYVGGKQLGVPDM